MNSNVIEVWSIKLAEVVAPDELDLAPLITEAFIRGGKERESLFSQQKESVLGGFGVTEVIMIFPRVLQSIANTSQLISEILSAVSSIKEIKEMLTEIKNKQKTSSLNQQETEVLPKGPYAGLKTLLQTFTDEISKSGLPREKCEIITYHTLLRLLDDPSNSVLFVKELSMAEKGETLNG